MVLGQAKMVFGAYAHESELASHPFRQSAATEQTTFSPTEAQETFVSSKSLQDGPNIGKAAVKGVAYGAVGTILGAGMSQGGIGGAVCGVLAGATLGMVTIGPMGDGKGADGLLYCAAGLIGGAIAGGTMGAMGLANGALIGGVTLGGIQAGRALLSKS